MRVASFRPHFQANWHGHCNRYWRAQRLSECLDGWGCGRGHPRRVEPGERPRPQPFSIHLQATQMASNRRSVRGHLRCSAEDCSLQWRHGKHCVERIVMESPCRPNPIHDLQSSYVGNFLHCSDSNRRSAIHATHHFHRGRSGHRAHADLGSAFPTKFRS